MARPSRYSTEVRKRAVRMVREHEGQHGSQWAAICSMAEKLGCTAKTLRRWGRQSERDAGVRPGLTTEGRLRLKKLERENWELKRANETLRKAFEVGLGRALGISWDRIVSAYDSTQGGRVLIGVGAPICAPYSPHDFARLGDIAG